jgi:hypothetical protein
MSKFKRKDKQTQLQGKKVKIFDLAPTGVFGKLKIKDFKGAKSLIKKGNKIGGVIKASDGVSVSPKLSDYTKNLIGKTDQGIGKGISKTKSILASVKEKIAKAGEIMRKGPGAVTSGKSTSPSISLTKIDKVAKATKSKALVTGRTAKLFKAARFARAVTPVGLAATAIAAGVKKRDPKAVKRERDFYKGKKYKDVGFESMMDYAKPKRKGGVISYNKGGFNYAINKKR